MRTIRYSVEVDCPFTAAIALAERCCARLAARRLEAQPLRDHTDGARRHTALSVVFLPHLRMPCPAFQMLVTARPWHLASRFEVYATYVAPLGMVGRVGDSMVGRHVARRIVTRFLNDLRIAVERAWRLERESWLPPTRPVDDPSLTVA